MASHQEGSMMSNATWPAGKPIPTFKSDEERAAFWAKYGPSLAERVDIDKAERVLRQRPVVVDTTGDRTRTRQQSLTPPSS
jgi:hypothetical protein